MEEDNLVKKWIDTDKKLFNILVEIQNIEKSEFKQAEQAFHKIPKMYNLPKMPEDNEDELFYSSVYEQLALFNFLEPDGDIRGRVLSAIFYVKNSLVNLSLVYKKQFGSTIAPNNFTGIGYKDEGISVMPVFVMNDQSWFELGCKYFTKE